MRSAARFVGLLVVGLAMLAWLAYGILTKTTRDWFEADVRLRARLAVTSARQSLAAHWSQGDARTLRAILNDITRDERIMGAAACSSSGQLLAASDTYPATFSCPNVDTQARHEGIVPESRAEPWGFGADLPGGPVHLSVVPVADADQHLGFVVLVHDLSYVLRRETTARNLLLAAFFVLALSASAVTFGAARVARRGWLRELRAALAGHPTREFQPLVRDVRELVERLLRENHVGARDGIWTPTRLRSALMQHLHGERVVVMANREPYIHERKADGSVRVVHPASGLVSALEPIMRACSGVWVAHGSGSADRETVDGRGHVRVPPKEESYALRRVWLTEAEETGYYYGFSNEGLWPLCHVAHARPTFRSDDWEHYRAVNQKFADAVCEEVTGDDPIVFVQDYHFALAPKMIRERLPRATILSFWHIPWPNAERFGICPWRDEILEGLLGSSIVGFHTQQHCNNFLDSVDTFLEARIDREQNAVIQRARGTLVRPYPISIEWPVRWLEGLPSAKECRAEVFRELGLGDDGLLGVGVDRLDYTKGIEERLQAVDHLLTRFPEFRGRFTFVQLAAPSRTRIERYQDLNARVESLAQAINDRWANGSYRPIVLHRAHHEPPTVFRYYRAADVCYVSSLHDGMNLVAKEFVAAREDGRGVLLLSQFTGAARELTEALIVNPYDLRQASDAFAAALRMPLAEQRMRLETMRRLLEELNIYRWAGRMLIDAADLRRRERLTGHLTGARDDLKPLHYRWSL
jgi:trehalose 6-phosphate synthase